jgi:hypothetical protein
MSEAGQSYRHVRESNRVGAARLGPIWWENRHMPHSARPKKNITDCAIRKILIFLQITFVLIFSLLPLSRLQQEFFLKNYVNDFIKFILPLNSGFIFYLSPFFIFLFLRALQYYHFPTHEEAEIAKLRKRLKGSLKELEQAGLGDSFGAKDIKRRLQELNPRDYGH